MGKEAARDKVAVLYLKEAHGVGKDFISVHIPAARKAGVNVSQCPRENHASSFHFALRHGLRALCFVGHGSVWFQGLQSRCIGKRKLIFVETHKGFRSQFLCVGDV